jgi:hypothetical protein
MGIVRRFGKYIISYFSKGTFVERDVFNHQKRGSMPLIEAAISKGILLPPFADNLSKFAKRSGKAILPLSG